MSALPFLSLGFLHLKNGSNNITHLGRLASRTKDAWFCSLLQKKPLMTLNSLWYHQLQITEHESKGETIHFTLLITLLQIDIVFRMTETKETVHMMVHDL